MDIMPFRPGKGACFVLTPDERKAIDGFDETMRTPYRRDGEKNLIEHMQNWNGTYDINMRYIHEGMDALGVMNMENEEPEIERTNSI